MSNLKEIIRKKLKEISATNQGGASFSAGSGETYATPFAFSKLQNHLNIIINQDINLYLIKLKDLIYKLNNFGKKKKKKQMLKNFKKQD